MANLPLRSPYRSRQHPRDRAAAAAVHPFDQLRLQLLATELAGADVSLRTVDGAAAGRPVPAEAPNTPIVIPAGTMMDPGSGGWDAMGGLVVSALRGRPVVGLGLAASAVTRTLDRALARQFARRTRLLVMRSEAAARRLALAGASAPIRVGADLAWLQPTVASGPDRAEEVLVIGDPPDGFVARALAGSLPSAAGEGVRLALGYWQGWGEGRLLADAVARRIPPSAYEVLPAWTEAPSALAAASRSQAVVALDVDGQLIAALARTPAVVISDDEECLALADELGHPAVPPAASGRHLTDALAEVEGRGWLGGQGVEAFRERAQSSVNLARLVISADDSAGPTAGSGTTGEARRATGTPRDLLLWPEPVAR